MEPLALNGCSSWAAAYKTAVIIFLLFFFNAVPQEIKLQMSIECLIDLSIRCTKLLCTAASKQWAASCNDCVNRLLHRAKRSEINIRGHGAAS